MQLDRQPLISPGLAPRFRLVVGLPIKPLLQVQPGEQLANRAPHLQRETMGELAGLAQLSLFFSPAASSTLPSPFNRSTTSTNSPTAPGSLASHCRAVPSENCSTP